MKPHVLVARLDSAGDVLLAGPAVRAVAARSDSVTFLCSPRGAPAARLLPGVRRVLVHSAPWIDPEPSPLDADALLALVDEVGSLGCDQAIVLTSFHQSPLPLALLLRLAGVPVIAAISEDYPGSLLDVRHRVDDGVHEVERALSLVATLGYELPADDGGRLEVLRQDSTRALPVPDESYLVVHPGASVPARMWGRERNAALVAALSERGHAVVVTGGSGERALTAQVTCRPCDRVVDLGGATTFSLLAEVLARAACLVCGNTGPAHLAAAVGTPVVSLFAPTVPAARWRPWGVPTALLGLQELPCAGCRARTCPVAGHPCLDSVTVEEVVEAVERILAHGDGRAALMTEAA